MGFEKQQPDYSGNGVALWWATDKNGKKYLKAKVLGSSNNINCFQVEKKE